MKAVKVVPITVAILAIAATAAFMAYSAKQAKQEFPATDIPQTPAVTVDIGAVIDGYLSKSLYEDKGLGTAKCAHHEFGNGLSFSDDRRPLEVRYLWVYCQSEKGEESGSPAVVNLAIKDGAPTEPVSLKIARPGRNFQKDLELLFPKELRPAVSSFPKTPAFEALKNSL